MFHLILFIKPSASEKGARLEQAVKASFSEPGMMVLRNVPDLQFRLQQPIPYEDLEIYLLFADSKEGLLEFFQLEEWLKDKRLILILPDGQKNTVSMAHRLRPRFICCVKDDYEDLCAVIGKMILKTHSTLCGSFLHGRTEST
jgi:hypothetical protein